MRFPPGVRIKDFGSGLQIGVREGTVDEQAIEFWDGLPDQPVPGFYEPRADDVIIDVGAHIGGSTLWAAGLVPEGRVLAVEACRENYRMLVSNIELNRLTNVEADHLALSDRRGTACLHHSSSGNWGHTITKDLKGGGEEVPSETLAAYLSAKGVRRCALAKLNCEGAEFPLLMGAPIKALRTIRRLVVLYHLELIDHRYSLSALETHLEDAGFELERREISTHRGRILARSRGTAGSSPYASSPTNR